jgi:alkylation response protein AidB-like acyl-CoA dehydrogenase
MIGEDAELGALREAVRKLLASSYPADVRRRLLDDPIGYDPTTWQVMARQLGLQGLTIPERYGGSGASAAAGQIVFEELGAALYSGPFFACIGLAAPALLAAGSDDARADLLPAIADGSLIATLATTEAGRGWDVADIATTAHAAGSDQWVLSGAKAYVVDAAAAGTAFVSARTDSGIGLFAVELDAPGCVVVATDPLDLTRRLATLDLAGAPARRISTDADAGPALAMARDASLVALTGEQVGGATACLAVAVDYARQREQFGHPIGQFQAVKHLCADMLVDVEAAAALAHHLSRSADAGDDLALPAATAEALCSDVYFDVSARMIQVLGGIGFTWEHDAHLYYRRAKSSQLLFGDGAWQRRRVSDLLGLGLPEMSEQI